MDQIEFKLRHKTRDVRLLTEQLEEESARSILMKTQVQQVLVELENVERRNAHCKQVLETKRVQDQQNCIKCIEEVLQNVNGMESKINAHVVDTQAQWKSKCSEILF